MRRQRIDQEALERRLIDMPDDLAAGIDSAGLRARFASYPLADRKACVAYVTSAPELDLRAARITAILDRLRY